MARTIEVPVEITLEDYGSYAHLAPSVRELKSEAELLAPRLDGRTVWMVNSTAQGGGVAEMLPTMVSLLRQLGVDTEWAVIETDEPDFFPLTKQLHNLIHGEGTPELDGTDRKLYERVNRANAAHMKERVAPGDIVVVHDPQPMPLAGFLKEEMDVETVWRCHIGLDHSNAATRAVWDFLSPYRDAYDMAVFSAPEYIPDLFGRTTVIYPAVNPLTDKNRELSVHRVTGVLSNAALTSVASPVVTPDYTEVAQRVRTDGRLVPANVSEEIGLLSRPIVTQISRWDRLKGFPWVLDAFARMKRRLRDGTDMEPIHRHRLELARLILAGPDPGSVGDDPEGQEVFDDLCRKYQEMDPALHRDVAILTLPMDSRSENALMVNAIQRTSSVVVQNSLREGFGLTIAEAMWKRVPVLSNLQACGPRQQIRDGLDGRMVDDPTDTGELARTMDSMLKRYRERDVWGRRAQRRAYDEFLIFTQVRRWLRLLAEQL